jgi:hypothetical protein
MYLHIIIISSQDFFNDILRIFSKTLTQSGGCDPD